ncbi:MAG: hypothetical protein AAF353_18030 [Pseudomonadota bacterium]
MKPICLLSITLSLGLLSACAAPPMVIGQPRASIDETDVVIYYIERPQCNFETVALLEISGGYFSLQRLLAKMRNQAAELGASGLYVTHTQQLDLKEYVGTAQAIRCTSA